MNNPLVSVVIPYYNSEKTIIRALKSVINQTYKNFEIILVNDGSNDNSYEVVENFINNNKEYKIKNLFQNNSGPSIARNNAIKNSIGSYIAFLDSDDEWLSDKLQKQVDIIKKFNAHQVGCNYNIVVNNKIQNKFITNNNFKIVKFKECLFKHYFIPSTTIVSKKSIYEVGLFPEEQKYMEDAYVFKLINRKYESIVLGENLVRFYKYLYGDSGLSGKITEMEKYELKNFKNFKNFNEKYDKKISNMLYFNIVMISIIKYLRRLMIVKLRKR